MTDIKVGPASDADRYLATDQTVWFAEVASAPTEEQLLGLPVDQRFAAEIDGADEGTYPGIYGAFPMTLAVPGADGGRSQVSCSGLTWVGVHPDHRRRGVLTTMLRHHFEQVHAEAGTHVSALHASEPAIYGRHGYGLASLELVVSLSRGATLTAPGLDDAAKGVVVDYSSTPPAVTDGPYGETKELFGGFWILEVPTIEDAVEWARRAPMAGPGMKAEIRRIASIDEFPQDNEWVQKERAWRVETGQL